MVDQGLIFPFKELIDECEAMKRYAAKVLDKTTVLALKNAKDSLVRIQKTGSITTPSAWEIPENQPLCTIWSKESQPAGKSKHRIRGEFSFVWDVRPLGEGKGAARKYFVLDGKASTVVRVTEKTQEGERCLARWTTEVGSHDSPGTHFHFQLNGFETPPFPRTLDIPRLPALLMSPFLAIELAIGELFQDLWRQHALSGDPSVNQWREIHKPRLERFFKWQIKCLQEGGSPWMALKVAKPQPDLLVSEKAP